MSKVLERIAREPVMLGELIKSAITLGISFGLKLTVDQIAALYGFVSLLGAFVVRAFVTPTTNTPPNDPPRGDSFDPIPPAPTAPSNLRNEAAIVPVWIPSVFGSRQLYVLVSLVLLAIASPILVGCSGSQDPQAQAAEARSVARAGYAATRMALLTLSEVHVAWMRSKTEASPATKAEIEASGKVLAAFEASKKALEAVRPWLSEGDAGSAQKESLLEALDMALVALVALESAGAGVPVEVREGLEAARVLVGGAS